MLVAQPSGRTCCVAALVECQIALLQIIVSMGRSYACGDEMAGRRVIKHISSVTDAGNHGFLRAGEFHAQAAADAPAQTASGGTAKITCRLTQAEMLL